MVASTSTMSSSEPFKINIPEGNLSLLHNKLDLARFPDELDEAGWDYGAPLGDVKRLVEYWKKGFNWRNVEEELNEIPQFTTTVRPDGFEPLEIHFIHQRSSNPDAIPLLFVHGWPGSFFEVTKLLPLLTEAGPGKPSFHVVAPSLPNFGFSQGTKQKGFGVKAMAAACHQTMLKAGYEQYVCQGGDWGWIINRRISKDYGGAHCRAVHSNYPIMMPPTLAKHPFKYLGMLMPWSQRDKEDLGRGEWYNRTQYGYNQQQKTKPQTLGYSMADSPVGLLAWIYEKLHEWTDDYHWTDDEVLTWVSIYWFSRAGPTAASRIYYEEVNAKDEGREELFGEYINVPLGIAINPKELKIGIPSWCDMLGPVVYLKRHDRGGHFMAYENPQLLAEDLQNMYGKGSRALGIVPGSNGYLKGDT